MGRLRGSGACGAGEGWVGARRCSPHDGWAGVHAPTSTGSASGHARPAWRGPRGARASASSACAHQAWLCAGAGGVFRGHQAARPLGRQGGHGDRRHWPARRQFHRCVVSRRRPVAMVLMQPACLRCAPVMPPPCACPAAAQVGTKAGHVRPGMLHCCLRGWGCDLSRRWTHRPSINCACAVPLPAGSAQRMFRAIMAMDSNNYPECCAAIYVVQNTAVFTGIWWAAAGQLAAHASTAGEERVGCWLCVFECLLPRPSVVYP